MNDYEKNVAAALAAQEAREAELDQAIKLKADLRALCVIVIGSIAAIILGICTKDLRVALAACMFVFIGLLPNCYRHVFRRYMAKKNREREQKQQQEQKQEQERE